jgi:Uma2 family endonuclease
MSIASELRLTNADLETMPEDGDRYEVVDGELFVSSAPGQIHHPIGRAFAGTGVMVNNERMRKTLAGGRFHAAPEIVIGILSPGKSNESGDRHVKPILYAARGVIKTNELTSGLLPGFSVRVDNLFV